MLIILLVAFLVYLAFTNASNANNASHVSDNVPSTATKRQGRKKLVQRWPFLTLLGSLISLQLSAKLILTHSVWLAQICGISERVIGLTVVAIGTSLPETITSIVGALMVKQIYGWVMQGSNIFTELQYCRWHCCATDINIDIVLHDLPRCLV